MGKVNLSEYKNMYLQTAKEYVDSLLVGYNKLVSDSQDKDTINQIHIASHSLKSQSQIMGFTQIANICLNIEKISHDALKGIIQLNNETISEIRRSVNKLNEILNSPKGTFLSGGGAVQAFGSEAQARRDDAGK